MSAVSRHDDVTFDEPWQAEAFATVVALNEAGHLHWPDWAQYLSAALAKAGLDSNTEIRVKGHDPQGNADYYRAWLSALEALARDKSWIGPLQLGARRETIRAYKKIADRSPTLGISKKR